MAMNTHNLSGATAARLDQEGGAGQSAGNLLCPHCFAPTLRRSRVKSLREGLLRLAGVAPYRCRRCFRRFHFSIPAMRLLGLVD